jgi:GNAT superfamily N-acetyltransferase
MIRLYLFLSLVLSFGTFARPRIEMLKTKADAELINQIAGLAVKVYREYPHLYVAQPAEYAPYVAKIAAAQDAVIGLLMNEDDLVGVIMGAPIDSFSEKYKQALNGVYDFSETFYLADLIIDQAFQKNGNGKRLYEGFENAVASKKVYRQILLVTMSEQSVIDYRPADYQSVELFWAKRGFSKLNGYHFIGKWMTASTGQKIEHVMEYWMKELRTIHYASKLSTIMLERHLL